ncbi:MAG TPA: hypothetical protein VGI20_06560 [Rhizomicrobium sp.]|jgi:hypothetical protein
MLKLAAGSKLARRVPADADTDRARQHLAIIGLISFLTLAMFFGMALKISQPIPFSTAAVQP